jgi:predicted TIM-barrel fold metal-dependent hydrolase
MDSMDLACKYENVYCDINGSLYSQIWIEELVNKAPVEKFVFSTDQVFNDPRIIVGRVLLSELTDREKELILYKNFENSMEKKLL